MLRRQGEQEVVIREKLYDGEGSAVMRRLLNGADEMYGKGRLFAHFTLEPGCSIGYHVHQGEGEAYYFLSGTGEFNGNGETKAVQPGDLVFTGDGEGHSLKNTGDVPLEFIALILYT